MKLRNLFAGLLACALCWAAPPGARAQGPTPTPPADAASREPATSAPDAASAEPAHGGGLLGFFRQTAVNAYLDTYYAFNFNRPHDGLNALRAFDSRHHRFSFNAAGLVLEKKPAASSRAGFRLDLLFGPAADYLAPEEPGGVGNFKHLHQAYGSYLAPVGGGLQIDFGKFTAWSGAESDHVAENWNYSRGLLYSFAQPGYYTGGLRATYAFGPKWSLMGAVVNAADEVGGPTFELSLSLAPRDGLTLAQTYTAGPEQSGDGRGFGHLFDTVVTYDLNQRLSLLGNYDYGFDRLADGARVRWQGATAALRYAPHERFALSPRFEWYRDYDGYTTGTSQRLKELTLTGEYRVARGLLARLEYRRDWSDQPVFPTADASVYRRTQVTLAGGLVWSFERGGDEPEEEEEGGPAPEPSAGETATAALLRPRVERAARASAAAGRASAAGALRLTVPPFLFRKPAAGGGPFVARPAFTGSLFGS